MTTVESPTDTVVVITEDSEVGSITSLGSIISLGSTISLGSITSLGSNQEPDCLELGQNR